MDRLRRTPRSSLSSVRPLRGKGCRHRHVQRLAGFHSHSASTSAYKEQSRMLIWSYLPTHLMIIQPPKLHSARGIRRLLYQRTKQAVNLAAVKLQRYIDLHPIASHDFLAHLKRRRHPRTRALIARAIVRARRRAADLLVLARSRARTLAGSSCRSTMRRAAWTFPVPRRWVLLAAEDSQARFRTMARRDHPFVEAAAAARYSMHTRMART